MAMTSEDNSSRGYKRTPDYTVVTSMTDAHMALLWQRVDFAVREY